jgi:hypothetical protein
MSSTKQMERLIQHRTAGIVDANPKTLTDRKVTHHELANPKNPKGLPRFAILTLVREWSQLK